MPSFCRPAVDANRGVPTGTSRTWERIMSDQTARTRRRRRPEPALATSVGFPPSTRSSPAKKHKKAKKKKNGMNHTRAFRRRSRAVAHVLANRGRRCAPRRAPCTSTLGTAFRDPADDYGITTISRTAAGRSSIRPPISYAERRALDRHPRCTFGSRPSGVSLTPHALPGAWPPYGRVLVAQLAPI